MSEHTILILFFFFSVSKTLSLSLSLSLCSGNRTDCRAHYGIVEQYGGLSEPEAALEFVGPCLGLCLLGHRSASKETAAITLMGAAPADGPPLYFFSIPDEKTRMFCSLLPFDHRAREKERQIGLK